MDMEQIISPMETRIQGSTVMVSHGVGANTSGFQVQCMRVSLKTATNKVKVDGRKGRVSKMKTHQVARRLKLLSSMKVNTRMM